MDGACKIQPKPSTWRDEMQGLKQALDRKATDRAYIEQSDYARLGFRLENLAHPTEVFGQSHCMYPSLRCTPEYNSLERLLGPEQVKLG